MSLPSESVSVEDGDYDPWDDDDWYENEPISRLQSLRLWIFRNVYPRKTYGAEAWIKMNQESNMFSVLPKYSFGYDDKK